MPNKHRKESMADLIRVEISQMIQQEMKDPRIGGMVSVTEVELTEDLRYARIFVSVLGTSEERKETFRVLQRATGFFRHLLAERLTIRYVPEIEFKYDEGIERGDRVLQLLRQVAQEEAQPQAGASPAAAEVQHAADEEKPRRRARIVYNKKP